MAGKHIFEQPIDLTQHEILNVRLQALITLPANPFEGQICYSSRSDIKLGALWNGTEWTYFGLTLEQIEAINNMPEPFDPSEIEARLTVIEGDIATINTEIESIQTELNLKADQSNVDEQLGLKANIDDLSDVAFTGDANDLINGERYIPLVWSFSGDKVFVLPNGLPDEEWTLSRATMNFRGHPLPTDGTAYSINLSLTEITLNAGWTPSIGTKIYINAFFVINELI